MKENKGANLERLSSEEKEELKRLMNYIIGDEIRDIIGKSEKSLTEKFREYSDELEDMKNELSKKTEELINRNIQSRKEDIRSLEKSVAKYHKSISLEISLQALHHAIHSDIIFCNRESEIKKYIATWNIQFESILCEFDVEDSMRDLNIIYEEALPASKLKRLLMPIKSLRYQILKELDKVLYEIALNANRRILE